MNYYNQIIATTTSFGSDNAVIGYTVRVTTLDFLDSFVMLGGIILFFVMIKYFKKIFK